MDLMVALTWRRATRFLHETSYGRVHAATFAAALALMQFGDGQWLTKSWI
ncbi:hypothetical protein [Belnapia rosea]|nr:hypothetical protein [Belnapia rosea]